LKSLFQSVTTGNWYTLSFTVMAANTKQQ